MRRPANHGHARCRTRQALQEDWLLFGRTAGIHARNDSGGFGRHRAATAGAATSMGRHHCLPAILRWRIPRQTFGRTDEETRRRQRPGPCHRPAGQKRRTARSPKLAELVGLNHNAV